MTQASFWIAEPNFIALQQRFDTAAKKALRFGMEPPRLIIIGQDERYKASWTEYVGKKWAYRREYYHDRARIPMHRDSLYVAEQSTRFFEVTVEGDLPILAGWRLIATVEHGHPDGNPDEWQNLVFARGEVPPEAYTGKPWCAHCGLLRRRHLTYFLRHESGKTEQVGSTCLVDFIGSSDAEALAKMAELSASLFEIIRDHEDSLDEEGQGGFGHDWFQLTHYLALVNRTVRHLGWVSREQWRTTGLPSTADVALEAYEKWESPEPVDFDKAGKAIAWALAVENQSSDFLWNLKVVAGRDVIELRQCGIAAAMIPAYDRAMAERERIAGSTSSHIGKEGEKIVAEVLVESVQTLNSAYGITKLHKFRDTDGNLLVWFASGDGFEPGAKLKIQGTVKGHSEFRGEKQTTLKRVTEYKEKPAKKKAKKDSAALEVA